jgi:hypothetical protein
MVEDNPMDLENIKEKQDEDNDLQQLLTKHPTWYSRKNTIRDSQLCFLRFDSMMSTMCLLDGGTHYHREAYQILQ